MSAATLDDAPVVLLPEHLRRRAAFRVVPCGPAPAATQSWPAPAWRPQRVPVRLTRRGVVVVSVGVALLAAVLVALAWLSAPAGAGGPAAAPLAGDTVAVAAGDSLWSIAERVAPTTDPRAEVALLQRLNRLDGTALVPGQVLRIR